MQRCVMRTGEIYYNTQVCCIAPFKTASTICLPPFTQTHSALSIPFVHYHHLYGATPPTSGSHVTGQMTWPIVSRMP